MIRIGQCQAASQPYGHASAKVGLRSMAADDMIHSLATPIRISFGRAALLSYLRREICGTVFSMSVE